MNNLSFICSSISTTSLPSTFNLSWFPRSSPSLRLWGLWLTVLRLLNHYPKEQQTDVWSHFISCQLNRAPLPTGEECFRSPLCRSVGAAHIHKHACTYARMHQGRCIYFPAPGLSTPKMKGEGRQQAEDKRWRRRKNAIHHLTGLLHWHRSRSHPQPCGLPLNGRASAKLWGPRTAKRQEKRRVGANFT